ncbi:MAG: leucyl aminopeptidase [Robiginitomaculum sp.]|nr:MAG: leucyl aminopeptidase [Robiginitomaculum sp.]
MERHVKVSFISPEIKDGQIKSVAVLPIFTGAKLSNAYKAYDQLSKKRVSLAAKAGGVDGTAGKSVQIVGPEGTKTNRLLVTGCGKLADFKSENFGARVVKAMLMSGETTLIIHLDGYDLSPTDAAQAALGAVLASYRFDKYRTKLAADKKPTLKAVKIAIENPAQARKAWNNFYGPVGEGTNMARDLVMEPANKLYPVTYAARIKKMEALGMKVQILGEAQMKKLGMGALLGVGQGSPRASQLVIMKWNGGKKGVKPVCLVGKGVTFDTGGISLKPGAGMWDMKGDMGGSAAVVGAMHTIAARKAKANVIGIVGLVENMPDGKAQNPGDIVTSMSGQTIEVQNTDAEGRLVLADALWYAKEKFKPKAMVNLATLTGAIITCLGHEYAGLFSNSDEIAEQLQTAADNSTEAVWRLPLNKAYDKLVDSPNADMKNITVPGAGAGSITAGQFLQRFVGDVPWAHLDIAGTAWKASRPDPREPSWATGFGARLMNRWVADNYEG